MLRSAKSRRVFLASLAGIAACGERSRPRLVEAQAQRKPAATPPQTLSLVEFSATGERRGVVMAEKVVKSDADWQQQLTPEQFLVTRRKGTERAWSGAYNKNYEPGVYRCVCCGNALFSSETKFDSGTGWPSFWAPIAEENVRAETDAEHGMMRVEVLCSKCDAHLGHVFEDGPAPTHLRYCMNSLALSFDKAG